MNIMILIKNVLNMKSGCVIVRLSIMNVMNMTVRCSKFQYFHSAAYDTDTSGIRLTGRGQRLLIPNPY